MRKILIALGVIVLILLGLFMYGRISSLKQKQEIKPYVTYKNLLYIASKCEEYRSKYNRWPDSLALLREFRSGATGWDDDKWGREFIFVPYNSSLGYGAIISYGQDGKEGGSGYDRDLEIRFPIESNADWNKQMGVGINEPRFRE